jgi:hypothetical protein
MNIIKEVRKLKSYEEIVSLGLTETTTLRQEKNLTMTFKNNLKEWGIYSSGVLRINIKSSQPTRVRNYSAPKSIEDWDYMIRDFKQYLIKNKYIENRFLRIMKINSLL